MISLQLYFRIAQRKTAKMLKVEIRARVKLPSAGFEPSDWLYNFEQPIRVHQIAAFIFF